VVDFSSHYRSRLVRFTLRATLVWLLVIGALLGVLLSEARRQRIAVGALQQLGCSIRYDDSAASSLISRFSKLLGNIELRHVSRVEADDLPLADAALMHLQGLTHLRFLHLGGTKITDAGLRQLQGLTQLTSLDLGDTSVTDEGLRYLHGMARLSCLCLGGTKVSDAGVPYLEQMPSLSFLDLGGTEVTKAGTQRLQHVLPNTSIRWFPAQ
jgi:hypothetical protein